METIQVKYLKTHQLPWHLSPTWVKGDPSRREKRSPQFTWCRVTLLAGATLLVGSPYLYVATKVSSLSQKSSSLVLNLLIAQDGLIVR